MKTTAIRWVHGAKQAIGAAIKMGQQLEVLNSRLEDELDGPLEIGIGLHRGNAIVGNMGYGDAMAVRPETNAVSA